jgi:hypothetical protein
MPHDAPRCPQNADEADHRDEHDHRSVLHHTKRNREPALTPEEDRVQASRKVATPRGTPSAAGPVNTSAANAADAVTE